ncbi:MAG: hypothetical protein ACKVTZ_06740 [Bacteroidia bacterium]
MLKRYIYILMLLITASGCAPKSHEADLSLNGLDFSNYIAIGSDYTAGYANDGLFEEAQMTSFPQILMNQVRQTQEGANLPFLLPTLADGLDRYYQLRSFAYNECSEKHHHFSLGLSQYDSASMWYTLNLNNRYNNMGIPYLRVADVDSLQPATPEGFVNVYFDRMQNPNARINYVSYIEKLAPTFFTVELGFNDIWWYVWHGGQSPGGEILTPVDEFEEKYRFLLNAAQKNHAAKGLLFTLPDVKDLPFLHYVGHQWENESDCTPQPLYFSENGIVRTLNTGEYVTLKGYENSISIGIGTDPVNSYLSDSVVISVTEGALLQQYITEYNLIIQRLAQEYELAVMDMNLVCKKLRQNQMMINGKSMSSAYLTGGFYSLDGWTTTPQGNALLTYETIKAINAKYKASIPLPDVMSFSGIKFP